MVSFQFDERLLGAGKGERKKVTQVFDGLLCYYQSQFLGRLLAVPKRSWGIQSLYFVILKCFKKKFEFSGVGWWLG